MNVGCIDLVGYLGVGGQFWVVIIWHLYAALMRKAMSIHWRSRNFLDLATCISPADPVTTLGSKNSPMVTRTSGSKEGQ